jgi:hypothetical protein
MVRNCHRIRPRLVSLNTIEGKAVRRTVSEVSLVLPPESPALLPMTALPDSVLPGASTSYTTGAAEAVCTFHTAAATKQAQSTSTYAYILFFANLKNE